MANYKIYGTNQPYSGRVVNVGNKIYTTQGGTLEGNSHEVVLVTGGGGNQNANENLPTMNDSNQQTTSGNQTNQDVVTAFIVGDNTQFGRGVYYFPNGTRVPQATRLHHHTIPPNGRSKFMTQHTMDGNEQDVFVTRPSTTAATRQTDLPVTTQGSSNPEITGGPSNQQTSQGGGGMGGGGSY